MTELALRAGQRLRDLEFTTPRGLWRLLLFFLLLSLVFSDSDLRILSLEAMRDAFLQVSVFVALTLSILYFLEHLFNANIGDFLRRRGHWHIPVAAFLGALPGCGGAIVVITQYVRGYIGFGSVISALTATMGDAAFLLLAREPLTGFLMFGLGLCVGSLSGWFVDWFHGADFLRPKEGKGLSLSCASHTDSGKDIPSGGYFFGLDWSSILWFLFVILGIIPAFATALQWDGDVFFSIFLLHDVSFSPTLWIGVGGALICFIFWLLLPGSNAHAGKMSDKIYRRRVVHRVIDDTSFITVWVIFGFLSYEIVAYFSGGGVEAFFRIWAPFTPLIAIIVGFLPGCGPQLVVTTLYLSGIIPLSAQIGNAISNDGDALFPALAIAPRAALVATLYSSIPAFIVAYSWFFLFEWR